MKCHHPGCRLPNSEAQYVRLGSTEQSCAAHLPDGCTALIEGDLEAINGWTHVDGTWRCAGGCDRYFGDLKDAESCDNCGEETCDDCITTSGECQVCCDHHEERDMVRSLR